MKNQKVEMACSRPQIHFLELSKSQSLSATQSKGKWASSTYFPRREYAFTDLEKMPRFVVNLARILNVYSSVL